MQVSITTLTATAVILATLSFGAHADTSSGAVKITGSTAVFYGDLNLDTEQGAKIMLQRIAQAAKKACGGHPTFSSYTGRLDSTFAECRTEAIARTVTQLSAPMVSRIYSDGKPQELQTRLLKRQVAKSN